MYMYANIIMHNIIYMRVYIICIRCRHAFIDTVKLIYTIKHNEVLDEYTSWQNEYGMTLYGYLL